MSALPWQARAQVSFTFDDGYSSVAERAAPILAARGFRGTAYVNTGAVGKPSHLTWKQIDSLQQQQGWEIGSHTVSHPAISQLNARQLAAELKQSQRTLEEHGVHATTFAAPYGDYDSRALAQAAKFYDAFRMFDDAPQNVWPFQAMKVQVRTVQAGVTPADVAQWLDEAIANKRWLVLALHDIVPTDKAQDWAWGDSQLAAIADEVARRGLPVVTLAEVFSHTRPPVLIEDFSGGLGAFRTDAPKAVRVKADNAGAKPEPRHAVAMQAGAKNVHLFSPQFEVTAGDTWVLESYVDNQALKRGGLGIYVDEYDAQGRWCSGQYLAEIPAGDVQRPRLAYTPSSPEVQRAAVQWIMPSTAEGVGRVDSVRFYKADR